MDYLSGKQNNKSVIDKEEKNLKSGNGDSIFIRLTDQLISCLNPDEKAGILEKFLTPEIVEILKDSEIIDCINAFFKNNLNISETSRNAFLHRNTLLYRIEKINKMTGLNIRDFEDAMTFRLLTIIFNKMNDRTKK